MESNLRIDEQESIAELMEDRAVSRSGLILYVPASLGAGVLLFFFPSLGTAMILISALIGLACDLIVYISTGRNLQLIEALQRKGDEDTTQGNVGAARIHDQGEDSNRDLDR